MAREPLVRDLRRGLAGPGMHDFILNEIELGHRVALVIDDEDSWGGMGWLMDIWVEGFFNDLRAAGEL